MDDLRPDSAQTLTLLERAQTGDRQAFDDQFARHRPYLRQMVELRLDPKLRSRVDPSDVVQEAHLEAFRRLSTYLHERPMPFRLWLRQIAYDRALKAWRYAGFMSTSPKAIERYRTLCVTALEARQ